MPLGSKCLGKLEIGRAFRFGFLPARAAVIFLALSQLCRETIEQTV